MKKLIFLLLIGLLLTACTKETVIIVENPDDTDGDGVKNIIEEIDGTNPEAPCSYLEERQNYNDTTEAWRILDCDGDGVTNGNEIDPDGNNVNNDDGTNPRNGCDFIVSQQTVPPSQEWSNIDCDEDGVTNGQEVNDGTDPMNPCSLILSSQTSQPEYWLAIDCDGDCVRNELELEDGTNPFDGGDFLGNGKTFYQIKTGGKIISLDQNEARLAQVTLENGEVLITYNYTNNKFTSAELQDGVNYSFEYQNDQLSKITRTSQAGTEINDIKYVGNTIIANGANAAPGQFYMKLTFDATGQFLQTKERFFLIGSQWVESVDTFGYDPNTNRMIGFTRKFRDYNPATGVFTDRLYENEGTSYQYYSAIKNPLKEALDKIKIPTYFVPIITKSLSAEHRRNNEHALFEPNYQKKWSWVNQYFNNFDYNEIYCTNAQNNPTRGVYISQYADFIRDIIFLYE